MGSYTELYFNGHSLFSTKSYVNPIVMTLFRESDRRVYKRDVDEGELSEPTGEYGQGYAYATPVHIAKKRLDIMGFTFAKLEIEFLEALEQAVTSIQNSMAFRTDHNKLWDIHKNEKAMLEATTLDDWIGGFRSVIERKLKRWELEYPPKDLGEFLLYENTDTLVSYFSDFRVWLRLILEACPDDSELLLDITEVTNAGYYDPEEAVCANTLAALVADYPANSKIVVLTEGSTDSFLLRRTMRLLHPEFADFYTFVNFYTSNLDGGASSLVKTIKAFSGSGISNRIVALFDNDTAAESALRGLARTTVPDNIKVVRYPDLSFAESYPTIGPGGPQNLDVNRLAGALELYFGNDVLIRNGSLIPVQWKGYDGGLERYQGELTDKAALLEAYENKLRMCELDPTRIEEYDWAAMRTLMESIFNAFA